MTTLPRAMQPLTQEQAFLRAICEDPFDDTPRLVYADWLEENGHEEAAQYVREPILALGWTNRQLAYRKRRSWIQRSIRQFAHGGTKCFLLGEQEFSFQSLLAFYREAVGWVGSGEIRVVVRFGFISEIACTTGRFLRRAGKLFARHPVREVWLGDRFPEVATWSRARRPIISPARPCVLPRSLFDRLPLASWRDRDISYRDRSTARRMLSAACVAYGREMAGLPPLPAGA